MVPVVVEQICAVQVSPAAPLVSSRLLSPGGCRQLSLLQQRVKPRAISQVLQLFRVLQLLHGLQVKEERKQG